MDNPTVVLPVTCPKCGKNSMSEFPIAVVAMAMARWNNMALYANCHEGGWDAQDSELERIRSYLGVEWLRQHCQWREPHQALVEFLKREATESSPSDASTALRSFTAASGGRGRVLMAQRFRRRVMPRDLN